MKKYLLILSVIFVFGCGSGISYINDNSHIYFELDVSDPSDDLFHVTVYPPQLNNGNNIYNFVSTAPGTYSNLNIGRFVKSFEAFDKDGNKLNSEKISTNKWQINSPQKVYKIVYSVEDTFDSDYTEDIIWPMSGSGIEENYILLNTFCVFGYFEGLQTFPTKLKIDYPDDWEAATALNIKDGYYYTSTYDELADSPFLIGEITSKIVKVGDINVGIHVYSDADFLNAESITERANDILTAAGKFVGISPVDRYKFIMALFDPSTGQRNKIGPIGALEHSYSSLYAMYSNENTANILSNFMAHEFFHIITPLNLHSEIIETYNFAEPVPSQHLWLYEGVTEWSAHIMQLRGGLIDVTEYLSRQQQKLNISDNFFDQNYSLVQLALDAYNDKGANEYQNIYQKAAVIACLLDLRLLDLSGGKKGLREVLVDLTKRYGKSKPFSEKNFFDDFAKYTFPEIKDFFDNYVKDSKPLPLKEYFSKIGINYIEKKKANDGASSFGMFTTPTNDGKRNILKFTGDYSEAGLKIGDTILKINGEEINPQNYFTIVGELTKKETGTKYEITVRRDNEELALTVPLFEKYNYNVFEEMENPTQEQLRLRNIWMQNLPL